MKQIIMKTTKLADTSINNKNKYHKNLSSNMFRNHLIACQMPGKLGEASRYDTRFLPVNRMTHFIPALAVSKYKHIIP